MNNEFQNIPSIKGEYGEFFLCDAIFLLNSLPDSSVDLCIIDPPYGTAKGWRAKFNMIGDSGFPLFLILPHLHRVMKVKSNLFIFCSPRRLPYVLPFVNSYFHFQGVLLIFKEEKKSKRCWELPFEFILWFNKGILRGKNEVKTGIFEYKFEEEELRDGKLYHPNQKPLYVIEEIIKMHTDEGDLVIDCFAGTGTTGIACEKLKRKYLLCDADIKMFEIAKERFERLKERKEEENNSKEKSSIFLPPLFQKREKIEATPAKHKNG